MKKNKSLGSCRWTIIAGILACLAGCDESSSHYSNDDSDELLPLEEDPTGVDVVEDRSHDVSIFETPPRSNAGMFFDERNGRWLVDSDYDDTPDEIELAEGTDPNDPESYPGDLASSVSPAMALGCASSAFRLVSYLGGSLCIHIDEQSATTWTRASNTCRNTDKTGRVCTYEDLAWIYRSSSWDPTYNSLNSWIGNLVGDDTALRGNSNITYNSSTLWENFETETNKGESRQYWCCHTPI